MRTVIVVAALVFAASFIAPAHAKNPAGWFFAPYVGADIERWNLNYDDPIVGGEISDAALDDKFNFYNFHAGARVHRHLGFELGYGFSSEETKGDYDLEFKGWNFDIMGYMPLDEEERFDLIITTGVARIKFEPEGPTVTVGPVKVGTVNLGNIEIGPKDETETILRGGFGFQYRLMEALSARLLTRYWDSSSFGASGWNMGVGLNFHF